MGVLETKLWGFFLTKDYIKPKHVAHVNCTEVERNQIKLKMPNQYEEDNIIKNKEFFVTN